MRAWKRTAQTNWNTAKPQETEYMQILQDTNNHSIQHLLPKTNHHPVQMFLASKASKLQQRQWKRPRKIKLQQREVAILDAMQNRNLVKIKIV